MLFLKKSLCLESKLRRTVVKLIVKFYLMFREKFTIIKFRAQEGIYLPIKQKLRRIGTVFAYYQGLFRLLKLDITLRGEFLAGKSNFAAGILLEPRAQMNNVRLHRFISEIQPRKRIVKKRSPDFRNGRLFFGSVLKKRSPTLRNKTYLPCAALKASFHAAALFTLLLNFLYVTLSLSLTACQQIY